MPGTKGHVQGELAVSCDEGRGIRSAEKTADSGRSRMNMREWYCVEQTEGSMHEKGKLTDSAFVDIVPV